MCWRWTLGRRVTATVLLSMVCRLGRTDKTVVRRQSKSVTFVGYRRHRLGEKWTVALMLFTMLCLMWTMLEGVL